MQHNDERPPTSGRPSLLSAEQQAEADRHRILGGLDDNPPNASAARSKRTYSWLAAALVTVVALGAGSAAWLSGEGEKEIVLASSAPLPATPAPAVPLATDPMPQLDGPMPQLDAPADGDDVSTAAILEDSPALNGAPAVPEQKKDEGDELTKLLENPGPVSAAVPALVAAKAQGVSSAPKAKVAAKPKASSKPAARPEARNVTPTSRAKPAARKTAQSRAAAPKNAPKAVAKGAVKPEKHPLAVTPVKKKGEVHPKANADSDVALLAALVAHSKAVQPKRGTSAAEKLRQCKALGSVSDAEACRERLCASSAKKEAQCRAARIAKAPSES